MGFTNKNTKLKLLTNMYNDKVEIESEALVNIVESIVDDLKKRNVNESIVSCLYDFIDLINHESSY
ncbi:MAG: hypothetical protein IJI98_06100 [Methanosphaera sp.]|nr:hypothetical protein [Methanosphaera sp.]